MTRGVTTLESMVEDLRNETGRSSNVAFGQDEKPMLVRLLQRTQNFLYWDHDWPFLNIRRDITLAAGQRYYDAPADMNFERIITVRYKQGNQWQPLVRGISMEQYSTFDSDDDVRADPPLRWGIIDAGSGDQLEIWPLPATDDGVVRFTGIKSLGAFISDNDTCTLDDTLIVLFAAAKLLARDKAEDAKEALSTAQRLYNTLKGRGSYTEGNSFSMAGGGSAATPQRGTIVIAPRSES